MAACREELLEPARDQPEEHTAVEEAEPFLCVEAEQRFLQDVRPERRLVEHRAQAGMSDR